MFSSSTLQLQEIGFDVPSHMMAGLAFWRTTAEGADGESYSSATAEPSPHLHALLESVVCSLSSETFMHFLGAAGVCTFVRRAFIRSLKSGVYDLLVRDAEQRMGALPGHTGNSLLVSDVVQSSSSLADRERDDELSTMMFENELADMTELFTEDGVESILQPDSGLGADSVMEEPGASVSSVDQVVEDRSDQMLVRLREVSGSVCEQCLLTAHGFCAWRRASVSLSAWDPFEDDDSWDDDEYDGSSESDVEDEEEEEGG